VTVLWLLLIGFYVQTAEDADLQCKLGFFLHIPFPPWDIFRLFPWADEILQGMLGKYTHWIVILIILAQYICFCAPVLVYTKWQIRFLDQNY
jgi:hypothetical protein